ncbi:MAG: 30S ribosomal protein S15 [Candidatus Absconditabacteria bacterium]|nr:30S ribosomal protein S15 [Candidatus Absconditabacteria bacterium]
MVVKKEKVDVKRHEKDTGSPEFQISLLSDEIVVLQTHLEKNKKDFDAKRSILKKVAKRRTLLKYLKAKNLDVYVTVSKKFGIK